MWDLPGPGLEPVSPALAGGFLTTAPPRKPKHKVFRDKNYTCIFFFWLHCTACRIWVPQPRIELGPRQWNRVLTTGLPGNSLHLHFKWNEELLAKKGWPFQWVLKWQRENILAYLIGTLWERKKCLSTFSLPYFSFLTEIRIHTKWNMFPRMTTTKNQLQCICFLLGKNNFNFLEEYLHQDGKQITFYQNNKRNSLLAQLPPGSSVVYTTDTAFGQTSLISIN